MPEYRTWLRRNLNSNPMLKDYLFLMTNPSTAGSEAGDDMSIRKCTGFTARWGGRSFSVGNLYSVKATNPLELLRGSYEDNVGPDNNEALLKMGKYADVVVAAWGAWPRTFMRAVQMERRLAEVAALFAGRELMCIGLSHAGCPLHPSRTAYTSAPKLFATISESGTLSSASLRTPTVSR